MGFDLLGLRAKSERGEYFRNNIAGWHPLAEYVLSYVDIPEKEAKGWNYNDGTVISKKTAILIADTIECLLAQGHPQRYEKEQREQLAQLPLERCTGCNGSGVWRDGTVKETCSACAGTGRLSPWQTHDLLDVENLKEFAEFCRDSGGFMIC